MKFTSSFLGAAGLVGMANAVPRLDRRQANLDPHTCACTPTGFSNAVTVTETATYSCGTPIVPNHTGGVPTGYAPIPEVTSTASAFTLPGQTGSYIHSIVTVTITNGVGQPSIVASSTVVPATSSIVAPVPTGNAPPPYSYSVVTSYVTRPGEQPSMVLSSTEAAAIPTSAPYTPVPGYSAPVPSRNAPSYSNTIVTVTVSRPGELPSVVTSSTAVLVTPTSVPYFPAPGNSSIITVGTETPVSSSEVSPTETANVPQPNVPEPPLGTGVVPGYVPSSSTVVVPAGTGVGGVAPSSSSTIVVPVGTPGAPFPRPPVGTGISNYVPSISGPNNVPVGTPLFSSSEVSPTETANIPRPPFGTGFVPSSSSTVVVPVGESSSSTTVVPANTPAGTPYPFHPGGEGPHPTESGVPDVTVTEMTSVYTTMCPASSVITEGGTTMTTTYAHSVSTMVTTTYRSTITAPYFPSQFPISSEVSPTETYAPGQPPVYTMTVSESNVVPTGAGAVPSVYTTTIIQTGPEGAPESTSAVVVTQSPVSTTTLPGGATSAVVPSVYTITFTGSQSSALPTGNIYPPRPPYAIPMNSSVILPTGTGTGVAPFVPNVPSSTPVGAAITSSAIISSSTATIYATTELTVTSCAETVTNCPARSTVVAISSIPVSTNVYTYTVTPGESPIFTPVVPAPSSTEQSPVSSSAQIPPAGQPNGPFFTPSLNSSVFHPTGTGAPSTPYYIPTPAPQNSTVVGPTGTSLPLSTASVYPVPANSTEIGPTGTAPYSYPSSSTAAPTAPAYEGPSVPINPYTAVGTNFPIVPQNSSAVGPTGTAPYSHPSPSSTEKSPIDSSTSSTPVGTGFPIIPQNSTDIGPTGTQPPFTFAPTSSTESLPLSTQTTTVVAPAYGAIPTASSTEGSPIESAAPYIPIIPQNSNAVGPTDTALPHTVAPTSSTEISSTTTQTATETAPAYVIPPVSSVDVSPTAPSSAEIPGYGGPHDPPAPAQVTSPSAPGYVDQPAAPACNLSPAYGGAVSDMIGALPKGSLNKVIPRHKVNDVVSALMGQIGARADKHITANGGNGAAYNGALPGGLPSEYAGADGKTHPMHFEGGMTLANIVDWCVYLTVKTYAHAGRIVPGYASGSASMDGNMSGRVGFGMDMSGALEGHMGGNAGGHIGGGASGHLSGGAAGEMGGGMGGGLGGGTGGKMGGGIGGGMGGGLGGGMGGGLGGDQKDPIAAKAPGYAKRFARALRV